MGNSQKFETDKSSAPGAPVAPKTVRVAQGLFVLDAVIWVAPGVVTLVRMAGSARRDRLVGRC